MTCFTFKTISVEYYYRKVHPVCESGQIILYI